MRQAERLAQAGAAGKSGRRSGRVAASTEKDADTLALERDLEGRLGLKVTIDHTGTGGQVVIRYGSLEQLDDLLARLLEKS